jgi:TetR/AcrR family transcriptional regulator, ethionamide resistance regulator
MARATVRQTRQESRERITRAAELLVRKRSYAELTVDELMSEAGLGRTIFYRHFDDLGDLLMRTSREAIEELWDAQRRLVAEQPGDPRPALEAAADVYERHGPLLRCVREAADVDERVAEGYDAMRRRFDDFAEQALRQVLGDSAPPHLPETARALNLMGETYLTDAFGREPRVSKEVAAQTLIEIWDAVIGR